MTLHDAVCVYVGLGEKGAKKYNLHSDEVLLGF